MFYIMMNTFYKYQVIRYYLDINIFKYTLKEINKYLIAHNFPIMTKLKLSQNENFFKYE